MVTESSLKYISREKSDGAIRFKHYVGKQMIRTESRQDVINMNEASDVNKQHQNDRHCAWVLASSVQQSPTVWHCTLLGGCERMYLLFLVLLRLICCDVLLL